MALYTYIFADLLTNQIWAELPLFGVQLGAQLNGVGDLTASIQLDNGVMSNQDTISATEPGRTALYVDRNGVIVWGGIIWSRTYNVDSKALNLTAQTMESYLKKRILRSDFLNSNRDPRNIVCDLFTLMQSSPSGNIGIQLPSGYPFGSGPSMDANHYAYEFKLYSDVIDEIANGINGVDWTIDCSYSPSGIVKQLLVGWPRLGSLGSQNGLVFDYPGAIVQYMTPETTSDAGNNVYLLGSGTGSDVQYGLYTDTTNLGAGYPLLETTISVKKVVDANSINNLVQQAGPQYRVSMMYPSFEVDGDVEPQFGSWSLGDDITLYIDDPARFPSIWQGTYKVISYSLTPSASDSIDDCWITVAGVNDI